MIGREMQEFLCEANEQIEVVSLKQKCIRRCSVKEFLEQDSEAEILVTSHKGRLRFYEK